MTAGTSVELLNELWHPLSEKINRLVDRIELIALAVDGLQHGVDALPHDNTGAVDTVVVALDELKSELSARRGGRPGGMNPALPLHLTELEQRVAVLQLSVQGLRATYATDATARADFDAVVHDATKLRSHLQGVRIECAYAEGGSRA